MIKWLWNLSDIPLSSISHTDTDVLLYTPQWQNANVIAGCSWSINLVHMSCQLDMFTAWRWCVDWIRCQVVGWSHLYTVHTEEKVPGNLLIKPPQPIRSECISIVSWTYRNLMEARSYLPAPPYHGDRNSLTHIARYTLWWCCSSHMWRDMQYHMRRTPCHWCMLYLEQE